VEQSLKCKQYEIKHINKKIDKEERESREGKDEENEGGKTIERSRRVK
jgi:hypothetical protein